MTQEKKILTDLEVVYLFCEKCTLFINPLIINDIKKRGLLHIVDYLPSSDIEERKAIAYARMLKVGKVFGDDEIDYISDRIRRLETLRKELMQFPVTDSHKVEPILAEMTQVNNEIKNYFKT
jgi:hypothetical protein